MVDLNVPLSRAGLPGNANRVPDPVGRRVQATFFAIVEPKFGTRYDNHQGVRVPCVDSIKVVRVTQSRPGKVTNGVVVKLTVRFSEQVFMPLQPQAVIDIPDSMVAIQQDVEVVAEDENGVAVAEHLARQLRGE